ncbi:Eukaryotic translation initiation factor 2D [Phlyctochytrium planicorne]|nr:Eukaryotic translation initiation factor 2D [Phlyctochytrium planicorne]
MFKKAFTTKSQTTVRSSDRRKLRTEILSKFPSLTEDSLSEIFPAKEGKNGDGEMNLVKILSHSGEQVNLYVVGGQPLFAKIGVDETLVPTVYALWALPGMLPVLSTWGVVMKKMFDGADLMLPGVIIPADKFADATWKVGDPVAVVVKGNWFPLAVGTMLVSADEMKKPGFQMKGKGVKTIHTYNDFVWAVGDKSDPPEIPQEELEDGNEEEDDGYEVVFEDDATETPVEVNMKELSLTDLAIPPELEEAAPEKAVLSPAEMDKLLETSLIAAIKTRLTDDPKSYPISGSVLYDSHVLPCRPIGTTLDMKNSGFKKLSKFLKAMEKKGYVKLKERNGDIILMSVNRKHPEIAAFELPRKMAGEESQSSRASGMVGAAASTTSVATAASSQSASTAGTLSVVELYKASGNVQKVWDEINLHKDTYFTKVDVKNALETYVKEKGLVADDPRLIKLDMYLAHAVLKKDDGDVEALARESLISMLLEKMQPYYQITLPNQDPVIKKGAPKPIQIIVEVRQGRKSVTRVAGMEAYGIDPEDLAAQLKVKCASSTTSSPLPGKATPTLYEVMVQGSKIREVCECLAERYHIPFTGKKPSNGVVNYGLRGGPQSKFVDVVDKTSK